MLLASGLMVRSPFYAKGSSDFKGASSLWSAEEGSRIGLIIAGHERSFSIRADFIKHHEQDILIAAVRRLGSLASCWIHFWVPEQRCPLRSN
jgi:hypothetical protein